MRKNGKFGQLRPGWEKSLESSFVCLDERGYTPDGFFAPIALYNLVGAIRGPDHVCDHRSSRYSKTTRATSVAKYEVTRRVRGILFEGDMISGDYEDEPLTRAGLNELIPHIPSLPRHFRTHLREAVRVSVDHTIWGGLGPELHRLLEGN